MQTVRPSYQRTQLFNPQARVLGDLTHQDLARNTTDYYNPEAPIAPEYKRGQPIPAGHVAVLASTVGGLYSPVTFTIGNRQLTIVRGKEQIIPYNFFRLMEDCRFTECTQVGKSAMERSYADSPRFPMQVTIPESARCDSEEELQETRLAEPVLEKPKTRKTRVS